MKNSQCKRFANWTKFNNDVMSFTKLTLLGKLGSTNKTPLYSNGPKYKQIVHQYLSKFLESKL